MRHAVIDNDTIVNIIEIDRAMPLILAMPSPSRTGWVRESAIHTEKDAFTAPTPKPSRRRKSCPSTRWQKPTNVLPRCRQSSTKTSSTQILES